MVKSRKHLSKSKKGGDVDMEKLLSEAKQLCQVLNTSDASVPTDIPKVSDSPEVVSSPEVIDEDSKVDDVVAIIKNLGAAYKKDDQCKPQIKTYLKTQTGPEVDSLKSIMSDTSLFEKILSKGCKKALRTQTGGRKKSKRMTKHLFCKFAKKRSIKRKKFLTSVLKKTHRAHKTRLSHLKKYCKTHKTKRDKKFCKKALKFSHKRLINDKRWVRVGLKRQTKRHKELVKYCKK